MHVAGDLHADELADVPAEELPEGIDAHPQKPILSTRNPSTG
jgi:hypothetical protein